jgi:ornithine cyclodeaminase
VVRDVFVGMAEGSGMNFPVVREKLADVPGIFGVKSGFYALAGYVGLKAGGYWPGNESRGIRNHQSATLLFDAQTGQPVALVAANYLTALRTAAAAALGTDALARRQVETLSVIGAGSQALPHIEAQALVQPFKRLIVASRDSERAASVAEAARRFIGDARGRFPIGG